MENIYQKILAKKGFILGLSPMEGITDTVFRQVLCKIGKPDVFFTEFLNVHGFCSKGREKVSHRLIFSEIERPIVFQLWGNVPEFYAKTIKEIKDLKPDGIDINMGCSVRDVISGGSGSALINDKVLAGEIIQAVKESSGDLPVSVKTRIGFEKIQTEEWIGFLLEKDLDLLTVHARLAKENYSVPCRWDEIKRAVTLRDSISPKTLILGNGDVGNTKQAKEYGKNFGVDGVLIGRAILANPWLFSKDPRKRMGIVSKKERFETLSEHLRIYMKEKSKLDIFNSQKKYIKAYISNFDTAGELRELLMKSNSAEEALRILSKRNY
ncbi:MAG TPA: tRNA-dihydrouridine synthase [Candidatus Dojkabacteria bacterium]|nr:tRNA-dihydrouridine synthase [Candidatus Dojkabacteria bacterium]